MPMGIVISIIATLLLTVLNGYFSMSEMALTTAKRTALERDAEEGDKRAVGGARARFRLDRPLLATIQVAITLVGFFSADGLLQPRLSDPLTSWVSNRSGSRRCRLWRPSPRRS